MTRGNQLSTYSYEADDPKQGITINEMMAALQELIDAGVSGEERLWSENKMSWGGRKGLPISKVHVIWAPQSQLRGL